MKLSVNDIVIKAVAVALKNVPEANGKIYRFHIHFTFFSDKKQKIVFINEVN